MAKKLTQTKLKEMIENGVAADLEKVRIKPKKKEVKIVSLTSGVLGINGALMVNVKSGKLYATTKTRLIKKYT